jgi:hypothetical protein
MKTKTTHPEGFTALHKGFRHKVTYGFRDGMSTLRLRRKYSLTQTTKRNRVQARIESRRLAKSIKRLPRLVVRCRDFDVYGFECHVPPNTKIICDN